MKWLNFILTLIAVGAIYYFLNDSIPSGFKIPFVIALILIAALSLLVVFKRENTDER
ncbi:hypothetical protein [Corticicoccus populi]|uniref:Uncharacterized protein n=1 Tax=Corticicoccus populi TaxID=1812821 RepID=A0ABW5X1T4_9STAP